MDAPFPSPVTFDADGPPRSRRYGDVYFPREGGLAQAEAVFLAGCGLPERWTDRRRFTVAELGFGTGLNIAALLDLWRRRGPPQGRLSIFSVEAEPMSADEAARALAAWPALSDAARPLLARWPGRRPGFHRVDLPEFAASLDVAVMEAPAALEAWSGRADAWFLDGFAPSANPAMWTDELMLRVAQRSAPGARAATYTVAGQVRRALAAAGFAVERRPGFGGKRERLEARLPGAPAAERSPRVAIIGAGVAGASLARAFRALGVEPRVVERRRPGAGASGNPAALVTPRLDAALGGTARLHAQALARAADLYGQVPDAIIGRGVLQFEAAPRDAARFQKIAASDVFEPGVATRLDAGATSEAMGEPAPPALRLADALTVAPAAILHAWLGEIEIVEAARLEAAEGVWRLTDAAGRSLGEAEIVCLASGAELPALWPEAPIAPVRGQLSWASGVTAPAAAWGAYVAPTREGITFGATHDRGDDDADRRDADDRRNLAALAAQLPTLAARLAGRSIEGRAAVRATTPDRSPLAGEIAPGLLVLGGLGSRGFTLAPLLGEHLAALALGAPSPVPADLARVVAPERFAQRARRRTGLA